MSRVSAARDAVLAAEAALADAVLALAREAVPEWEWSVGSDCSPYTSLGGILAFLDIDPDGDLLVSTASCSRRLPPEPTPADVRVAFAELHAIFVYRGAIPTGAVFPAMEAP